MSRDSFLLAVSRDNCRHGTFRKMRSVYEILCLGLNGDKVRITEPKMHKKCFISMAWHDMALHGLPARVMFVCLTELD